MPNVTVPAAASGLPKLNRRTALAVLSMAIATPVVAAGSETEAAILEAAARLTAAIDGVAAAVATKTSAIEAFERAKPALPRRLVATRKDLHMALADDELDAEGRRIPRPAHSADRLPGRVVNSSLLQIAIDQAGAESEEGRYAAELLPIALRYERRVAMAREASGIDPAFDAEYEARRDLAKLALSIAEMPIRSLDGLRVKAEAFDAYSSLGIAEAHHAAVLMAPALVRDLMTIVPRSRNLGIGGPADV